MSAHPISRLARAAAAASLALLALSPAVARAGRASAAVEPARRAGAVVAPAPDRVRLNYVERGSPSGPAVIFLHGLSDSWFSYSEVLPLLPVEWRAIALDLRGHGGSDRPSDGYTMRDLAGDVIAFMDARGIAKATIVGHSMGSVVAQQVAAAAPGRVARLVLVGSGPSFLDMQGVADLKRAVDALRDPVDETFIREFQASTVHLPIPDAFMERAVAESRRLPAHVWKGLMEGMLATSPATELGSRRIPTLVLWGDHDTVFGRSAQDALVAMIPGAELKVYANTGHALHWEQPEAFARDLREFVER